MKNEKKIEHLSIFLIKKDYKQITKIIKENECEVPVKISVSGCGKATLYIKKNIGNTPKWSSFFEDPNITQIIGTTSNVSAAFVLNVARRYFVLTFGQGGRFLLNDDVYEDRFGLLVALNSVNKESLRCIDKQSLDTIQSHTRIQSGQETTADQFGIDVEQDMLKAIVGTPSDSSFGHRMTGTDSLSVTVKMKLSDLSHLLKEFKSKYEKDLSATDYQWVNNISIVKNSSDLINVLDQLLLKAFANSDFSSLWLAIPEIIQWDLVKGFIFTSGKRELYPDINLNGFLKTLKGQQVTLELLKSRQVFCADEEHKNVFKAWSIYKCIYFEVDLNGNKYIFNDAKWFFINADFVTKTNTDFDNISKSKLILPKYKGGGEGKYNLSVSETFPEDFALLDDKKKIFHGGGHGQVEVCDLFSKDKHLIHVKIYGKSSVLSHLISQGFVSGQLLQIDSEFRKKVIDKLPNNYKNLIKENSRPAEKEFTVIFAVISDTEGKDLYLPFFSRVNINNTAKILTGFGYNVELLKINYDQEYSKTTVGPPPKVKNRATIKNSK